MERVEVVSSNFCNGYVILIDGRPSVVFEMIDLPLTENGHKTDRTIKSIRSRNLVDPDAELSFTDAPIGERAAVAKWRDDMLDALMTILGPNRGQYYSEAYGSTPEESRLASALRHGADAFSGHFAAFFEILCKWIEMQPLGAPTVVESVSPLAPGEPPPGVFP